MLANSPQQFAYLNCTMDRDALPGDMGRALITDEHRIRERDLKVWDRLKQHAVQLGRAKIKCPCSVCEETPTLRTLGTVEKHVLKDGLNPLSRARCGQRDRDSSDEEWERGLRVQGNMVAGGGADRADVGDNRFAILRVPSVPDRRGNRPTGYVYNAASPLNSLRCESYPSSHSDHAEDCLAEPETRFQDAIYDMFHKIDSEKEAGHGLREEMLDVLHHLGYDPNTEAPGEANIPDDAPFYCVDEAFDDPLAAFSEALQPMFEGCKQSTLEFVVVLVNLCTEFRIPQVFIDGLLRMFQSKTCPDGNRVPPNWYHAKLLIHKLGLHFETFHACKVGCVLFRNEYADMVECPKCHEGRYKKGTKIPVNKIRWFPLIPRLLRMYRCPSISELMTWGSDNRSLNNLVHHVADCKQSKLIDELFPWFPKDPRNVRLGLMLDGVNAFNVTSVKHSMWPIMIVNYNLPPWLTTKIFFVMLSVLISGAKSITQENTDVYLQPLYEELNTLWNDGVPAYDCHGRTGRKAFKLHACLLWTINDYPALGYIGGLCTGGVHACSVCGAAGPAAYSNKLGKIVFLNHRQWLPEDHIWRTEEYASLFNGFPEYGVGPKRQSAADIQRKGEETTAFHARQVIPRARKKKRQKNDPYNLHGIHRRSALFNLEPWKHLPVRHCIDVMHLEKNICESLIGFLIGVKDTPAVRDDMQARGIRPELWMQRGQGKRKSDVKPQAPYVLTEAERDVFMKRLKRMRVPDGFSGNWEPKVELDPDDKPLKHKLFGLKSHDFHVLMQQLLPVCIRGLLSDEVRSTILSLSSVFQRLCSKVFDPSGFERLRTDTVLTLCRLEMCFPPAFFDVMTHLLLHAVEELEWCGPVHTRWMYFGERTLSHYTRYSKTRANIAGSVATCYETEETCGFLTEYMTDMDAYDRRIWDKDEEPGVSGEILKGFGTPTMLEEEELLAIHNYVVDNAPILEPWRKAFKELQSGGGDESMSFAHWLRVEMPKHFQTNPHANSDLLYLSRPPPFKAFSYKHMWAYGCHYRVFDVRAETRPTYDSGISGVFETPVGGDSDETVDVQYVGEIVRILHVAYKTEDPVVLLKARWVRPHDPDKPRSFERDRDGFLSVNFRQLLPPEHDPYVFPRTVNQVFFLSHESRNCGWRVVMTAESRSTRLFEDLDEDDPSLR